MASPHFHLERFTGDQKECESYLNARYQGIKAMGGTLLLPTLSFHPDLHVYSLLVMLFAYTLDDLPDNSTFIDSAPAPITGADKATVEPKPKPE